MQVKTREDMLRGPDADPDGVPMGRRMVDMAGWAAAAYLLKVAGQVAEITTLARHNAERGK